MTLADVVSYVDNSGDGVTDRLVLNGAALEWKAMMADANLDDEVGIADLSAVADNYGETVGMSWLTGDFNLDGEVGIADLSQLRQRGLPAVPARWRNGSRAGDAGAAGSRRGRPDPPPSSVATYRPGSSGPVRTVCNQGAASFRTPRLLARANTPGQGLRRTGAVKTSGAITRTVSKGTPRVLWTRKWLPGLLSRRTS